MNSKFVCRQHIDGRRLLDNALCPQAALCTLYTVVVQARNPGESSKAIDNWLIVLIPMDTNCFLSARYDVNH